MVSIMYEVFNMDFNERKRIAEYWFKKHKSCFVVLTFKDGSKITGVLKALTPINFFLISHHSDKEQNREIDPLYIVTIYARPDKFSSTNNGGVKNLH